MSEKEVNKDVVEESIKEEKPSEEKPKKKNSGLKYLLNIVLVLVVTAVATIITLFKDPNNGPDVIFSNVMSADYRWILATIGVALLSTFIQGLILVCYARLYTRRYHIHQGLACYFIGTFYSGVTPGASGGQVMQAYTYKKQGVPISAAASIMVMQSIIYQVLLIIYGVLSIVIKSKTIFSIPAFSFKLNDTQITLPVLPLIILGFGLNLMFISLMFLMSYWKSFHRFVLGPVISFLAKIKILKNPDKKREDLRIQVENFKIELKRLLSNIPFLILIVILTFLVMTCNFSVPFFLGKALGSTNLQTVESFWDVIFYYNFHQMVTGLVPIPGAAGISEYFYNALFTSLLGAQNIDASQLLWRTINFTIPLIIGGFISAFYRASPKEETRNKEISRQTFVSLQHETFIERSQTAEEAYATKRLSRRAIMESLKKRNEEDKRKAEEKKRQKEAMKATNNEENDGWGKLDINNDEEDD